VVKIPMIAVYRHVLAHHEENCRELMIVMMIIVAHVAKDHA
jgi:hypothetical protein